jgi:spore coat protein CotH
MNLAAATELPSAGAAPTDVRARPVEISDSSTFRLFELTRVWQVHLEFAPDQWEALEPAGGFGPFGRPGGGAPAGGRDRAEGPGFFGPPGNGAGPGGRGFPGGFPFRNGGEGPAGVASGPGPGGGAFGFGPGAPGPGEFGPSLFLAPVFLHQGDTDGDGRLSAVEFGSLGEKWFTAWDSNRTGQLDADKLRDGLNSTLTPPGMGGAGDPREPGRSEGPGGPAPGLSLQAPEGKRNGLAGMMGLDFPTVRADLDFAGMRFPDVTVRYKGNGTFMESRGTLKRSLKIDLNDGYQGRKLGGVTKLNFHNGVTDPSWMNEVLSHRLFRDAGVPAPRTAYAQVFLTVPGQHERRYLGLYSLVENVDNRFVLDRFGTKKGVLLKPATRRLFEDLGPDWAAYRQSYDAKTPVTMAETQRVIDLARLVSHASDAEFAARLAGYLDLDAFARFMAVTVWLSTLDSILGVGQNYLVYLHPMTRQFQFIPWDLDHSFGQFPLVGTQEQRETLSVRQPWQGENRFLERVFRVPAFERRYRARLRAFSETIFQPERLHGQVDELAAALRPAVQAESEEKLARFDRAVAGEPVARNPFGPGGPGGARGGDRGGSPGAPFGFPGGFGAPPKPIKGFVAARAKSVTEQLAGRATGTVLSGVGFGGPGGPGGRRGPGGPGGPGGFGPGMFLGPVFLTALDADKDGTVSHAEFSQTFQRWFETWNTDPSGSLSDPELRAGIDKDLAPFRGQPPGGFGPAPGGFGPPPGTAADSVPGFDPPSGPEAPPGSRP